MGVVAAGALSFAPARADPADDPITTVLNGAGAADNSSVSDTVAGIGRSICPMLVKPGATFASIASRLAGDKGLSPEMAGFVVSMAIQMECPGFMTSLADGKVPLPLQGLGGAGPIAASPFQLPGL